MKLVKVNGGYDWMDGDRVIGKAIQGVGENNRPIPPEEFIDACIKYVEIQKYPYGNITESARQSCNADFLNAIADKFSYKSIIEMHKAGVFYGPPKNKEEL